MLWSSSSSSCSYVAKLSLSPTRTVCCVCFRELFSHLYRALASWLAGWLCVRAFFGCMSTRYFSRFSSLGCQTAYENCRFYCCFCYYYGYNYCCFYSYRFATRKTHRKKMFFSFPLPITSKYVEAKITRTQAYAMLHKRNVWENFRHSVHIRYTRNAYKWAKWSGVYVLLWYFHFAFSVSLCVYGTRGERPMRRFPQICGCVCWRMCVDAVL